MIAFLFIAFRRAFVWENLFFILNVISQQCFISQQLFTYPNTKIDNKLQKKYDQVHGEERANKVRVARSGEDVHQGGGLRCRRSVEDYQGDFLQQKLRVFRLHEPAAGLCK